MGLPVVIRMMLTKSNLLTITVVNFAMLNNLRNSFNELKVQV